MRAVLELFKQTFKEWSEDKAPRLAAALAYYTAFSLAPILVIALWVVNFFIADTSAGRELLLDQVGGLAGLQSRELVGGMLEVSQVLGGSFISMAVGLVALIFGASGVFLQLEESLNTIWEVAPKPNRGLLGVLKDRFLSFGMVLGVGFLLLVSLLLSTLLAALSNWTNGLLPGAEVLMQMLNFLVSFGVITVLFAMIFKYVPDAHIRWQDVWLGAAVTALLFVIGKFAIGLYLGNGSTVEQFGAAGSLVVILLWVYYSAQIIFFGAEFTQVYANKYGKRIVPSANAVPLTEQERLQQGMSRRDTSRRDTPHQESLAAAAVLEEPVERKMSPSTAHSPRAPHAPAPAGGSLPLFVSLVCALLASVSGYIFVLTNKSKPG